MFMSCDENYNFLQTIPVLMITYEIVELVNKKRCVKRVYIN